LAISRPKGEERSYLYDDAGQLMNIRQLNPDDPVKIIIIFKDMDGNIYGGDYEDILSYNM
jgi:hypothetical protein